MTNVYILNESEIPEFQRIRDVLQDYYPVKVVDSWDNLEGELKRQDRAVVVFTASPQKVSFQAAQIKTLLPTATCIAVNTLDDAESIPGYQFDVDFLLTPITRFEILSRVSTASRLTDLLASVEESAQLDEVTQLYNRRYFLNRLNEEISLAKRHMSPLSVVIIGINFFQMYLDSYGYDFVNELLQQVALVSKTLKRQEDIVARIGDDEVALLLPRSTEKGAKPLADRIVQAIQNQPFKSGNITEELSVHSGIAGYPLPDGEADTDADAIVRFARHALHNARCSLKHSVQTFSEIKPAL